MVHQNATSSHGNQNDSADNSSSVNGLTCDHLRTVVEDEFYENGTLISGGEEDNEIVGEFDWSPKEQGVILGSFFWGYGWLFK